MFETLFVFNMYLIIFNINFPKNSLFLKTILKVDKTIDKSDEYYPFSLNLQLIYLIVILLIKYIIE